MLITATEFKSNIGKYLKIASNEDVYITKNGKSIAKLTNVKEDKLALLDSLVGILPDKGQTLDNARRERLERQ